jgi:hypothetical protein
MFSTGLNTLCSGLAALLGAIRTRSETAGINKYTPHQGTREIQRRCLQQQRVVVLTADGKTREMNAWLAKSAGLPAVGGFVCGSRSYTFGFQAGAK